MIIISACLTALFSYFIIKLIRLQHLIDLFLISFLLVCAHIIVAFEISSLCKFLNQQTIFIFIQFCLSLAAFLIFTFFRDKITASSIDFKSLRKAFFLFIKQNKGLFAFFIFVGLIYLCFARLSLIIPQNTTDSLYNHLARIGHWLQQGTLQPYDSFSSVGPSYPYDNSLLMMWTILFLHSDKLTGLLQWFASGFLALSIFGIARSIGFSRSQAAFSGLIFLTFPIVFLQSITAQNDILAATFFVTGIYFFIDGFKNTSTSQILMAALSFGLAVGTKQYIVFTIPASLIILLYFILKDRTPQSLTLAAIFVLSTMVFTLIIGSYAYLQNAITFKNPVGPDDSMVARWSDNHSMLQKLVINSNRSFELFLSCEGLPLPWENTCMEIKGKASRKIFSAVGLNLESKDYLLVPNYVQTGFSYTKRYPLNEESAWFGILSWVLLIPGIILAIVAVIRKKAILPLFLILLFASYNAFISLFLAGWEPYQGRFFILSIALVMPFTGYFYSNRKFYFKIFAMIVMAIAAFILFYTFLSNDSKPLINQNLVLKLEKWGESHSVFVMKFAIKVQPWIDNDKSFLSMGYTEEKNYFTHDMTPSYLLVTQFVPPDANLGIISNKGFVPDYLYFGNHFTRKVFDLPDFTDSNNLSITLNRDNINYLLVFPNINVEIPNDFQRTERMNGWNLYERY